ncbi:hypothetical protein JYU34_003659 [Plutella xylostella]|uniref:Uncharacterized protein n=1 Tax=Plutella xylostella TaxID=51655 RepID=A0ABQ7R0M2_PLUXY|nr:hypothetical protein JYU34_003659 [Plutella xylostella]
MWRGTLVIALIVAYAGSSEGRFRDAVQRIKRSPHYNNDCSPHFYPPPPPPPPPRPFWPPPPPPYWRHYHHHHGFDQDFQNHQGQGQAQSQAQSQVQSQAQSQAQSQMQSQAQSQAQSQSQTQQQSQLQSQGLQYPGPMQEESQAQGRPAQLQQGPPQQPCSNCGQQGNSAVSNSRSDSGSAIALAIARTPEKN